MKARILIDLERCVGCWTCAMACKVGNGLADDEYRVTVRTLGSGTGIDRPAGVYPNLNMGWLPVYETSCVLCAPRVAEGQPPYCSHSCPTEAIAFGDADDDGSDYTSALKRVRDAGYRIFELPAWENKKSGITYASRK
jgi:Fe-S-cluster-containing dehydrogenase component